MGLRRERHNKLRLFHLRLCLTQRQSLFGSQKYTSNCISSKPPAREEDGGRTRQEEAPPAERVCVCDVSENVSISKCKQKKRGEEDPPMYFCQSCIVRQMFRSVRLILASHSRLIPSLFPRQKKAIFRRTSSSGHETPFFSPSASSI